jgi:hypothetical protein
MAIWDFRPKADIWTGLAIGTALLVAPVVIPVVATAVRPVLKAALKGGILVFERGRETIAEIGEVLITYTGSLRSLGRFARSNELFDLRRRTRGRTPLFGHVAGTFAKYNNRLMQITGGQIDLPSLAFLSLIVSGVYQVVRGNITAPAWYTAFYYALGVFSHKKFDEIDEGGDQIDEWDQDSELFSELDLSE